MNPAYHGVHSIITLDDLPEKRPTGLFIKLVLLDDPPTPPEGLSCAITQWITADVESATPKVTECSRFKARGILLVPREMPPFGARLRRVPYKMGKPVSCRVMIEFRINAPLNVEMWKKLKVPPPWRKSPRGRFKNSPECVYPVRLYAYQPVELSKDQIEFLQAQIALMEIA